MISEYKLYHGAVLADIIDRTKDPVTIQELFEEGRLLNYTLNASIGIQIRFATQRLRPWPFSFSCSQISALSELKNSLGTAFLVLVCGTDGILAIEAAEVLPSLLAAGDRQAWLRVDRKKREQYRLTGPLGEFKHRYPTTTEPVVTALASSDLKDLDDLVPHPSRESLVT